MYVACFVGAIAAAAFGPLWLAAMLFTAGLLLAGVEGIEQAEARRRRVEAERRRRILAEVRRHG